MLEWVIALSSLLETKNITFRITEIIEETLRISENEIINLQEPNISLDKNEIDASMKGFQKLKV
jgi:hypothetical protein